jgi:hypothetical protein
MSGCRRSTVPTCGIFKRRAQAGWQAVTREDKRKGALLDRMESSIGVSGILIGWRGPGRAGGGRARAEAGKEGGRGRRLALLRPAGPPLLGRALSPTHRGIYNKRQ